MAKTWFNRHNDALARIGEIRNADVLNAPPVRIAILDSGIELSQEQRDDYDLEREHKIVYKSWIDKENMEWKDKDGHGTHLTILTHRIAPRAAIYVARVYETDPGMETNSRTNIAEVNQSLCSQDMHAANAS